MYKTPPAAQVLRGACGSGGRGELAAYDLACFKANSQWQVDLRMQPLFWNAEGSRRGRVCAAFVAKPFICNFLRHQKTAQHMEEARQKFNISVETAASMATHAPSATQFATVWGRTRSGHGGGLVEDVAGRKKLQRMRWCLAEGMRELDARFLQEGPVDITLHRDKRQNRMLVRFVAANSKLLVRRGVLGQTKNRGGGAKKMLAATKHILKVAATRRFAPPQADLVRADACCNEYNRELYNKIRNDIRILCVDSASDELLTGRLMRQVPQYQLQPRVADQLRPLCKNLQQIERDKAHATRRLMSRPWKVDPFLQEIVEFYIRGKRSMVQILGHSNELNQILVSNMQAQESGIRSADIRNLRSAKHRMESFQKPLGRFILFFHAFVATAIDIAARRAGQSEGKAAEEFLESLTQERVLQMAMLADAADECMMLLRFFDTEDADPALTSARVSEFMWRIMHLFGENCGGHCLNHEGYTKYTLELLQHVVTVNLSRKRMKSIGDPRGVSHDTQVPCLNRMHCWVRLAAEVLRTDFPSYELMQAYSVFNVGLRSPGRQSADVVATEEENLERIASSLALDKEVLVAQFRHNLPIADRLKKSEQCSNGEAWRLALATTQYRKSVAERFPVGELLPALRRYRASGISTSGIEQNFSKAVRSINEQQLSGMGESSEAVMVKIILDFQEEERDTVIELARRTWAGVYGKPRGRITKLDVRAGRPQPKKTGTEREFITKRRENVAALPAHPAGGKVDPSKMLRGAFGPGLKPSQGWTEAHENELSWHRKQQLQRRAVAWRAGLLLPQEINARLVRAAGEREQADLDNDRARTRKEQLVSIRANPAGGVGPDRRTELRGKRVFIAPSARNPAVYDALRHCLATTVDVPDRARLFVACDPALPGERCTWCASLKGSYIVDPGFVLDADGRKHHAIVHYTAATTIQRQIWVSERFTLDHRPLWDILKTVCSGANNTNPTAVDDTRWTLLGDRAAFLHAKGEAIRKKVSSSVIALVVSEEARDADLAPPAMRRHVFTKKHFIAFVSLPDRRGSATGLRPVAAE